MSTAESIYSFDVTEAEFDHKVLAASWERPVVVDFEAAAPAPVELPSSPLERLVAERGGTLFLARVNVDQSSGLAARYRVNGTPAVIAFKYGQPTRKLVGIRSEAQLKQFLDRLVSPEADRLVKEAQTVAPTDAANAEQLYRQAVKQDPRHDEARLGLAQLLLGQGKWEEVVRLLNSFDVESEQVERARRIMAEAALGQRAAGMGDVATARARVAEAPNDARRHFELGFLLAAVQRDYPAALEELRIAVEADRQLAKPVRDTMKLIFIILGEESPLPDEYRKRLPSVFHTFDVTETEFETKVLAASRERPIIVDFWATWCAPCRALAPVLERVLDGRPGDVSLAKLDIDHAPEVAARYRIEGIPAVIGFKDGKPARKFVGVKPEAQIKQFLEGFVSAEADRLVKEAQKVAPTDADAAEQHYRQAVQQDPGHDEARLGLAQLLLAQGKTDGVVELLEGVTPDLEQGEQARRLTTQALLREKVAGKGDLASARARLAEAPADPRRHFELGCFLALEGDYPAALAELLTAAETDRELGKGPVREAMVQVFHALGDQHPLSNDYRYKLSRAIN